MVELETVSIVVASAALTVAAIYYILTLRSTYKNRQAILFSSMQNKMDTVEFRRIYRTICYTLNEKTPKEIFDMWLENPTLLDEMFTVISFFNHMGWLVKSGLLGIDAMIGNSINTVRFYGIVRPWIDEVEARTGAPQEFPGLTYLFNEMKRNQALVQSLRDEARRTRY